MKYKLNKIKISIILPIKNEEKHIAECLESILTQSFADFELLIYDDDSCDKTLSILNGYADPRINIITTKKGLVNNLNSGIKDSQGTFIARMDGDDIMHPQRLETQLYIMESTGVDICSSWMMFFGENIQPHMVNQGLSGPISSPLKKLAETNYIAHPTVMLRKKFLVKHGLQYENYPYAEDYKLWSEVAKLNGQFYIEPQTLVAYRISEEQVSRKYAEEVSRQTFRIQNEILRHLNS